MAYRCKHPTCAAIIAAAGYCDHHQHNAKSAGKDYDQHQRDQQSKEFYSSRRWQRTSRVYLTHHPVCEYPSCRQLATLVHHRQPVNEVRDAAPHLLYSACNLMACCAHHHNQIHKSGGTHAPSAMASAANRK